MSELSFEVSLNNFLEEGECSFILKIVSLPIATKKAGSLKNFFDETIILLDSD